LAADRAAELAGALLLAGLALPWAGWEGLRTPGLLIGLAAAGALAIARSTASRMAYLLAAAAGVVAAVLIGWRIASPPSAPILAAWHSTAALALGLAGSALVVAAAVRAIAGRAWVAAARASLLASVDRVAWRSAWRAALLSRALVWTAAIATVLANGYEPSVTRPASPFGALGRLLTAPATAWDGSIYPVIAQFGYAPGLYWRAFYPGYPAVLRAAALAPAVTVLAGIAVSTAAFVAALYLLHRLVALECDRRVADLSVLLVAFSPMAFFFSAIYTESLFLLLSVAALYAARNGWWARAGLAGALAATTRVTGLVLLVPLLMYAARGDRRRALPWLAVVAFGGLAYFAYSAAHGDPFFSVHAERIYWHRSFAPLGVLKGLKAALDGLRTLGGGHALATPSYQVAGQLSIPRNLAAADVTDFAFLLFAAIAGIGSLRRLPAPYGVYSLASTAVVTFTYLPYEPLASLPRYVLVAFPCQIWLAIWARTPARARVLVCVSAAFVAYYAGRFASWRWVA
jgi:hypothetical protein